MDITKEEGGQIKIAAHESNPSSPQSSIDEPGESTPEEGLVDGASKADGESEGPVTLADLLGYAIFIIRFMREANLRYFFKYSILFTK